MTLREFMEDPKKILEDKFKVRVIPRPDNSDDIPVAQPRKDIRRSIIIRH